MQKEHQSSFMEKVATFIVDRRTIFFFIFLAACIFSVFSKNWVDVNDDITKYLPEDTATRQGLTLMNEEFVTFGTAEVMVDNITYDEAVQMAEWIETNEGVKSVEFDDTEDHYKGAAALFSVTFDGLGNDDVSVDALNAIQEKLSDYDVYVSSEVGNPLKAIINKEMLVVDLIAVFIVVSVLLLTSQTYGEIPVLLITFGAAAILNMGTNFLMGEVSFVTDAVAIVLQLALAIDYAIILCHRYEEEHETKPPREAAITALSKAIPEIAASSLTTVSSLIAMCLMQFKLGYDMGSVLIKAILLSLCSVFFLMPGLLVLFSKLIDRTHHKNFVPKINFLGKAVYATRFIMPVVFVVVLASACYFSHQTHYVYGQETVPSIKKNEAQLAAQKIDETFETTNQLAVIVPSGSYEKEAELIKDIEDLQLTDSVIGLANQEAMDGYCLTDALNPRQFSELTNLDYEVAKVLYAGYALNLNDYGQAATNLENYKIPIIDLFEYVCDRRKDVTIDLDEDTEELLDELEPQLEDAKLQLKSDDWTRIVVELNMEVEDEHSLEYLNIIQGLCAKYYEKYYVIGETPSCKDLADSFENDNVLISILSVVFVILVLLFTFKSVGLPLLLIMIIQGSIWINFAIPYIRGADLYFLTYLIISSIQMGANIDYAIVISSRYLELKEKMPLKEAMINTLNLAFPTIITSGTMLASAGIIIGFMTSNETISAIGMYLGIGTIISIFLVMCVLPQILLLGDIIIRKTSFSINRGSKITQHSGIITINGRVRGTMNGIIDADVRGIFRGDLNGIIDMGSVRELSEELPEEGKTGHKESEKEDSEKENPEEEDNEDSENNEK